AASDSLHVEMPDHWEQAVDTRWQLIWQNDELMALFKPAPLAVSRTTRNLHDTLIARVRRETPYPEAQLLHRLDIETSGLILVAKNSASDRKWKPQLKQLITRKIYHAIVGGVPTWETQSLQCELAEREDSEIRCKMHVVQDDGAQYRKPKHSHTQFNLLASRQGRSLVECALFSGRKHQIRAHLAHLGHPIVGDKIYSFDGTYFLKRWHSESGLSSDDYRMLGSENHQLRAVGLTLEIEGASIELECPGLKLDHIDPA
ncbi:MAG: RluA family pseudouridine synthase, partial [Pseudomonadales bacterium]